MIAGGYGGKHKCTHSSASSTHLVRCGYY